MHTGSKTLEYYEFLAKKVIILARVDETTAYAENRGCVHRVQIVEVEHSAPFIFG